MPLREILGIALASLGVNKLRSALTMLGITIGVFSVIGVMTAVSALQSSIESGISSLGANMFQIAKFPGGVTLGGNNRFRFQNRRDITYEQGKEFIKLMEGVSDFISLRLSGNGNGAEAKYNGRATNPIVEISGTNENFLAARQYVIESGRNLTQEDVDMARSVVVIGKNVENALFPNEIALGKVIKLDGRVYNVIGVFAEKKSAFGSSQDDVAAIPITKFIENYGYQRRSVQIAVQAPTQELYDATMEHSIGAMRKVRGLKPEQDNDFEIYSNDSLVSAFDKIANVVAVGAFIISAVALLAAGVGIMNIMLVSVTERTKEIGIRKSIGAKKANILAQFLFESVTISLMGGLAGIVLGVLGGNGVAIMLNATVIFPWGWAIAGIGVCSAIGVGFGLYPAYKAASLDPIEALRFE